jgi:hypothetical protein
VTSADWRCNDPRAARSGTCVTDREGSARNGAIWATPRSYTAHGGHMYQCVDGRWQMRQIDVNLGTNMAPNGLWACKNEAGVETTLAIEVGPYKDRHCAILNKQFWASSQEYCKAGECPRCLELTERWNCSTEYDVHRRDLSCDLMKQGSCDHFKRHCMRGLGAVADAPGSCVTWPYWGGSYVVGRGEKCGGWDVGQPALKTVCADGLRCSSDGSAEAGYCR